MQHEENGLREIINSHFLKPIREVGYTKIQEFINRTRQVKIVTVNISFLGRKIESRSIRVPP